MNALIKNSLLLTATLIVPFLKTFSQGKPNVLMIVIDDLNDYPLQPKFNQVKTPNLDVFAKNALNFSRAYCAGPICNPSRASVISGIAPYHSGIYNNRDRWETSNPVNNCLPMPMAFKQNGYTTLWSGKFWHGYTTPKKEMLDVWWDEHRKHTGFGPYPTNPGLSKEISPVRDINYEMMDLPDSAWQDTKTADETINRLKRDFDKPFFMVCGFVRPHVPWTSPKRFYEMYNRDSTQTPHWIPNDWNDIPAGVKKIISNDVNFDKLMESGQWKDVVRAYLASISFLDFNLGRVTDALAKSKYAENTVVVIWADHGYHLGEKSKFEKSALWERTTHNMLMIKTPYGDVAGKTCVRTVNLLDIYPTLVDLCNLKNIPKNQLDGHSLMPLLNNPSLAWEYPAVTTYLKGNHAVRDERYRYIYYPNIGEELYDMQNDPDEFINLANKPGYEKIKRKLKTYLPKENAKPSGDPSIGKKVNTN
jgi:arylsulfatase A-like enzyme